MSQAFSCAASMAVVGKGSWYCKIPPTNICKSPMQVLNTLSFYHKETKGAEKVRIRISLELFESCTEEPLLAFLISPLTGYCCSTARPLAVVERQDDSALRSSPGDYSCRVEGCGWIGRGVRLPSAYEHVRECHPEHQASIRKGSHLKRQRAERPVDEIRERNRQWQRACRERKQKRTSM